LTLSLGGGERKTFFTDLALIWLEIKISWKITAQTLLSIGEGFIFRTFYNLLSLCIWLFIGNYTNV